MSRVAITDMGHISLMLDMQDPRNRETESFAISRADYTRSVVDEYGMYECNSVSTPRAGEELSLDQPERSIDNEPEQR